ncbi:MAG TPA: TlyA family RNA methyltransferase [Candidatus Eremiobacteraeota bacterium]|nr:MAG: 16S/23S rRNA (cytidine-2'-O)-methyltransferase TlyA [bacterium ADurb.Bin363]HPZ07299.1 TlyA family RNA methyltransferase [Candidatus Eremiobacteraeota bacterium]
MSKKLRLDILLLKRSIFPTREKARSAIMAGRVFVNGHRTDKPGHAFSEDAEIELKGNSCPYASRGGLKLEKALSVFSVDLKDKIAIDIGASTGGFTDCMLKKGIERVYAVDVGYGQLAWSLRQDERVVNIERKNARYLTSDDIPEKVHIITIDVSFISLTKILPVVKEFLLPKGHIISLIKPQFEAGKEYVGKGGVVKRKEAHIKVLTDIISFSSDIGLSLRGLDYSPLQGPAGNMEFLIYLDTSGFTESNIQVKIENCVLKAHEKYGVL